MIKIDKNQTLSLAATIQCCILVQQLARLGATDENTLSRLVSTIFNFNTADPEELYFGSQTLKPGLKFIVNSASTQMDQDRVEVLSLINAVQQVQKSVTKNSSVEMLLGKKLQEHAPNQNDIPYGDSNWSAFNQIYVDTLSTIEPKIIVKGEANLLKNPVNVNKIRSGLLAAVRSAYLWNTVGGRRWHLLLWRKQYLHNAQSLLSTIS